MTCKSKNACLTCSSKEYFVDEASGLCKPCSSALEDCLECESSAKCIKCQEHYFIDSDGKCGLCSSVLDHCVEC